MSTQKSLQSTCENQQNTPASSQRIYELEQENATMYQELAALRVQRNLTIALRTGESLEHTIHLVLEAMLQLESVDSAGIALADDHTGECNLVAHQGMSSHLLAYIYHRCDSTCSPATAYAPQQFCPSPLTSSTIEENIYHQTYTKSVITTFPILHKEHCIGELMVVSSSHLHLSSPTALALEAIAAQIGSIIVCQKTAAEHKQSEERIQRHIQRIAALRQIDKAITSSIDLPLTLNILLDQVTTHLAIDAAAILLLKPHLQILEYAASKGFNSTAIKKRRLHMGESYAGRAALKRCIIAIPDTTCEPDPLQDPFIEAEHVIAYYCMPLIAKGQVKGVLELFHQAPLNPDKEWLDFMGALVGQAAIAVDNAELFSQLQHSNEELIKSYDHTIEGWARTLELRDAETEGHTRRVTELTMKLVKAIGIPEQDRIHIRRGAILHDIGKVAIPDSILLKAGPLTEEERSIMQRHTTYAYEMLLPIAFLRPALDIPYCHHEKWDGTGYPRGLKGAEIPLAARIFAVVDVFDALCSKRPYHKARTVAQACAYIREQAGKHFDPQIVEIFLRMLEQQ